MVVAIQIHLANDRQRGAGAAEVGECNANEMVGTEWVGKRAAQSLSALGTGGQTEVADRVGGRSGNGFASGGSTADTLPSVGHAKGLDNGSKN